jgi:hypothetical protein
MCDVKDRRDTVEDGSWVTNQFGQCYCDSNESQRTIGGLGSRGGNGKVCFHLGPQRRLTDADGDEGELEERGTTDQTPSLYHGTTWDGRPPDARSHG